MQIQGKTILVTGGGRGLGAALGRELARRGGRLVLVARHPQEVESVAAGIRTAGGEAHALTADIADKNAIYPLVGKAAALAGPIDILIHNASILGALPLRELVDTECEDFSAVLEANVLGPFRLTKAVAGSMIVRGQGLVLGITSDASVNGYPGWGGYGVSKAALDQLLRTWAAELDGSGVRFLTVNPGDMDTQMYADALPEADRSTLAHPADVAAALAGLIEDANAVPSGTRLDLAAWSAAV
jgi:NAD(P)-dependent dehydrogenase (short-subunit alcohol dehydrogenase family)